MNAKLRFYTPIALIFAALIAYWWTEYRRIPTDAERRRLEVRVIPALAETRPDDLARIEINGGPQQLIFERRGKASWRMLAPVDTIADPALVESLAYNLKSLRKSPDARDLTGPDASFGLGGAERKSIVLRGNDSGGEAIATVELGKVVRDRRFVRVEGDPDVQVVDAGLLAAAERPERKWRQRQLFTSPTVAIQSMRVQGTGRDLFLRRARGRWRLEGPFRAPADEAKAEGQVATVAGLTVAGAGREDGGFVSLGVDDFTPFGLDKPDLLVTLSGRPGTTPETLEVGEEALALESPGGPTLLFARRAGEAEVLLIDAAAVRDLGARPDELRGRRIVDVEPDRVDALRIRSGACASTLVRTEGRWQFEDDPTTPVDAGSVSAFLGDLHEAEASERLSPGSVGDAGLGDSATVLDVWTVPDAGPAGSPVFATPPDATVRVGRRDAAKKSVYVQTEGDPAILAVPEKFLNAVPTLPFSFRDKTLAAVDPTRLARITIRRFAETYVLMPPDPARRGAGWRLVEPVVAAADPQTTARLVQWLSAVRAEKFVAERPAPIHGVDHPAMTLTWSVRPFSPGAPAEEHTLRVGAEVRGIAGARFGMFDDQPLVFILAPKSVEILDAEFRDRHVLALLPDRVARVLVRWPDRTASFDRRRRPLGAPPEWVPTAPAEDSGVDPARVETLIGELAAVVAPRFLQHDGPFPAGSGLTPPQVSIRVEGSSRAENPDAPRAARTLKIGASDGKGSFYATTSEGDRGEVFLLPNEPWGQWVKPPQRPGDLPEQVFAAGQEAKEAAKP